MVGSKTGAFTLPASIEGVLEPGVLLTPFDIVDMVEMVDDMDSLEAFLLSGCSDGRREGRAGEGWVEGFLIGKLGRGAGAGFAGCSIFCPVRIMLVGGGSTPFLLGRLGSLPMPLLESLLPPYVCGAVMEWLLWSREGLSSIRPFQFDGLAVTGARPTWPTLRAAMRACMEEVWVSSAMATERQDVISG